MPRSSKLPAPVLSRTYHKQLCHSSRQENRPTLQPVNIAPSDIFDQRPALAPSQRRTHLHYTHSFKHVPAIISLLCPLCPIQVRRKSRHWGPPKTVRALAFGRPLLIPRVLQRCGALSRPSMWETPYAGNCPALLFRLLSGLPRHAVNCGGKSKCAWVQQRELFAQLFSQLGGVAVFRTGATRFFNANTWHLLSVVRQRGTCVFKHAVVVLRYS